MENRQNFSRLLKSKMALYGDNYEKLSEYLNVNIATLCNKITKFPTFQFNQREIGKIIARYQLTAEDVMNIFFNYDWSDNDEQH